MGVAHRVLTKADIDLTMESTLTFSLKYFWCVWLFQALEVEELRGLKKEDFMEFFQLAIRGKQTRRKLSVHVIGAAEQKGSTICDGSITEPANTIEDIWVFKQSQELYPCA